MAKITIYGLAGTGTSSVGKALASLLQYRFISPGDIFRNKAESLGLDLYQFEALCNADPKYDKELDDDMKEFGRTHDNFVAESRLVWHFIPDSYKIKFICDFDERIKRVASRDNLSFEEAKEKTGFRETSHEKRFADYYGIKEFAPDKIFNFIIDTTNISQTEVIEKIREKLKADLGI